MRVLVTGGAGFIGSHLVDHHIKVGDEVVVVDDFSTGSPANLAHHQTSRLRVFAGRAENRDIADPAFKGVELVYHLAAAVGVFEILKRPLEALRTNLDATEAVFERATAAGVRTIFTSTSEVYGKNTKQGLAEHDDSIFGPTSISRWLYAVSKAADEFMALAYHREHGLPVTVVRLFNTTGSRQTGAYGMVAPRFVRQALASEPLTIFGDGKQSRCFTNVHDVVRALTRLAQSPQAVGRVVNVGQPLEISILDLARLVVKVTKSTSEMRFVPYEQAYGRGFDDVRRRVPNVDLLRELVGEVPETSIEETIRQVVAAELARGTAASTPREPSEPVRPAAIPGPSSRSQAP